MYPVLVYIQNLTGTPDTYGETYFADYIEDRGNDNVLVNINTDKYGYSLDHPKIGILNKRQILNCDPVVNHPVKIYMEKYEATEFAVVVGTNEGRKLNPLMSTSSTAFGSGIYGRNERVGPTAIVISSPFYIKDRAHGDSIIRASTATNNYLDRAISLLEKEEEIFDLLERYEYKYLVNLWTIVFARVDEKFGLDDLEAIMTNYLLEYLNGPRYYDSIDNSSLIVLPINRVMGYMGYNGLYAMDSADEGWNRGSVSYSLDHVGYYLQGNNEQ